MKKIVSFFFLIITNIAILPTLVYADGGCPKFEEKVIDIKNNKSCLKISTTLCHEGVYIKNNCNENNEDFVFYDNNQTLQNKIIIVNEKKYLTELDKYSSLKTQEIRYTDSYIYQPPFSTDKRWQINLISLLDNKTTTVNGQMVEGIKPHNYGLLDSSMWPLIVILLLFSPFVTLLLSFIYKKLFLKIIFAINALFWLFLISLILFSMGGLLFTIALLSPLFFACAWLVWPKPIINKLILITFILAIIYLIIYAFITMSRNDNNQNTLTPVNNIVDF